MKEQYILRAKYNLNCDVETIRILSEVSDEIYTQKRGGIVNSKLESTTCIANILAHTLYVSVYVYQKLARENFEGIFDKDILKWEIPVSRSAQGTEVRSEVLEKLVVIDKAFLSLLGSVENTKMDITIEHLLAHQIHHRGQVSQILGENGVGDDFYSFKSFIY